MQAPIADVGPFIDWLSTGRQGGDRYAAALVGAPPPERDTRIRAIPRGELFHTIDAVLRRAADRLLVDREEAVTLTALATAHLPSIVVPRGYELQLVILRGAAWREHANALRSAGDLPGALAAAENAVVTLSAEPRAALELAMARRVAALVQHLMGDTGQPEQIIREDLDVFRAHGDVGGEVRSLLYVGVIEFDHSRFGAACAIFEDALRLAESLEDHAILGSLHNNIGQCAERLGDVHKAIAHLVTALRLFELYGLETEYPRPVWGLAHVNAASGGIDEAVAQLERVADELAAARMPLEASRVWLDIVDLLLRAERYAEAGSLAEDLAERFTAASASREAARAFAQLRDAAAAGALDEQVLSDARRLVAWRVAAR